MKFDVDRKLSLEVFDPTGNKVRTHHFFYNAGIGNFLRLKVGENTYYMDCTGRIIDKPISVREDSEGNITMDDKRGFNDIIY
jgi:hypothetical protein